MKIYIDLLPRERKQEMKKSKIFRTIIRQEIRLLIPLFFFMVVLAAINFNLGIQAEAIEKASSFSQNQKEYQDLKLFEDSFKEVNAKTSFASNLQQGHIYWSNIFQELENVIPEGVYLTDVSNRDYQLVIAGKAKTRDNLLEFQDNIKNSECFMNINMPLSNLVNKEDIVFQMDFAIKKECFKNK
jgi:Tfp pilus assembly protein PilN